MGLFGQRETEVEKIRGFVDPHLKTGAARAQDLVGDPARRKAQVDQQGERPEGEILGRTFVLQTAEQADVIPGYPRVGNRQSRIPSLFLSTPITTGRSWRQTSCRIWS